MGGVSTANHQRSISKYKWYDYIVLLYVCSFFVFENANFAQVFNIIQVVFLGTSAFVVFRRHYIRKSRAYLWTIAVLGIAVFLAILYRTSQVWGTLSVLFRNSVKVWFFTIYLKDDEAFKKLIGDFAIGGLLTGSFLISEFSRAELSYSNLKYATISRIGSDIAGGNVNIVSMNMCFAFAAMMYLISITQEKKWRVIYAMCAVFIVGTSLLTGSRKILIFYIMVFILYNIQRGPKFIISFLAVAMLSYLALMYIEPLYFLVGHKVDFFRESTAYTMYDVSDESRLRLAQQGLSTFFSYPWGIGFGNSYNYIGSYAHNNFIEILMDGGIFGFIIYYSLYFNGIRLGFKHRKQSPVLRYAYISLVGLMVLEVGQVTYLYSVPVAFFAIVLNLGCLVDFERTTVNAGPIPEETHP